MNEKLNIHRQVILIVHFTLMILIFGVGKVHASPEVAAFWDAYDPHEFPLNVEIVQSWETAHGRIELVRYHLGELVGTNKSASPVIAAYYGYPKNASADSPVPGIVQIHGGGQRANKNRVEQWMQLGYACISINWGAKILAQPDTPNTDWDGLAAGFIRPGITRADKLDHHNTASPGPNTLFKEPHLLNSSWNLIAMSARRALTFLEQRPEVDNDKLGVEGHSMGGRGTVLTAIDPRVKAASPSVGGSGYLYEDIWGLPGSARIMPNAEERAFYQRTVAAQAYWPHITAPVLFLGSTNDFNSPTEFVVRGMSQLPDSTKRVLTLAPHLNHRFTPSTDGARFMWMEAHLKGAFTFPKTSSAKLELNTSNQIPLFTVQPDISAGLPIEKVEVYYGYARDPRIRFWRSAEVTQNGDDYTAQCPVFNLDEPLFAFANITYKMDRTLPKRPGAAETNLLTISSEYKVALPEALKAAGVVETEKQQRQIDDFSRGWQDWYTLSADNPHHWFYATRKLLDPSWMGPKGGQLAVDVITDQPGNHIAISAEVNTWQNYTGRHKDTFHAIVELQEAGTNSVLLSPSDFKNTGVKPMRDWDEITELTFTPAWRVRESEVKEQWQGSPAKLQKLRWEGGAFIDRPHPHESRVGSPQEGGVAFDDEFQIAIDDSVKLEQMDEAATDGKVYLTKEMAAVYKSFWRVLNNKGVEGKPISIGGKSFDKGLGVHAPSKLVFPLEERYATFHVVAGPDDAHHGLLEMQVLVDGEVKWQSGPTRSTDGRPRETLSIDVSGAKTLTLIVEESDGNKGGDHASWADAHLVPTRTKQPRAQRDGDMSVKPNVLIIYADDIGRGDLSHYGQANFQTPNIDRLADQGMSFDKFYGCTVCAPARASLLTGNFNAHATRPNKGGLEIQREAGFITPEEFDRLVQQRRSERPGRYFLGQMAKTAGYHTAYFGKLGVGYTEIAADFERYGFDHHVGLYDSIICWSYYPPYYWENGKKISLPNNPAFTEKSPKCPPLGDESMVYTEDVWLERCKEYMTKRAKDDQPFLAIYATQLPHGPTSISARDHVFKDHEDWPEKERIYASMMVKLDQSVANLLEHMDALGLADNTIVIFTGDNGHEPQAYLDDYQRSGAPGVLNGYWDGHHRGENRFDGTLGQRGIKRHNFEGGLNVPFFIRWPGKIEPGAVTQRRTGVFDILPTLAEVMGVEVPVAINGISFLPTLTGEGEQQDHDYLFWINTTGTSRESLIAGDWKLIYEMDRENSSRDENKRIYRPALYNLADDPYEKHDLAGEYPDRVAHLQAMIQKAKQPLP